MSKKKSGGAKSGTTKIPKKIAGVKIPKGLRDSGNAAVKLAQSPMARELLSAGLAAAAAAVAANARARKTAGQSGANASTGFADVADAASKAATEIKAALKEAAAVAAQQFGAGIKATTDVAADEDIVEPVTADAVEADAAVPKPRANGSRPRKVDPAVGTPN